MNKKLKWLVLSPLILASSSSLASCSNNDGYLLLRVINSEDYIYLNDPTDPESAPALIHQFEDSEAVKEFLETKYPQYKGVKVIYDTSDTNETLYSELQTGKTNYDLMNVSDYMAQKIVSNGLAVPLYEHDCKIENYFDYASVNIKTRLDNIIAKQKYYDSEEGKIKTKDLPLADYAVGYMWGTLGILFNPNYSEFSASMEEAIYDMQSYGALWDSKYKGQILITALSNLLIYQNLDVENVIILLNRPENQLKLADEVIKAIYGYLLDVESNEDLNISSCGLLS